MPDTEATKEEEKKVDEVSAPNTGETQEDGKASEVGLGEVETRQGKLDDDQFELIKTILGKETFIDPIEADEITKAYSVYDKNPSKIIGVVIVSFQQYCRKCLKETALLKIKNELSFATFEEAENLKNQEISKMFERVRKDPVLEHILVMLVFKNFYWNWIRYGLKEIFAEQRKQVGHELNSHLNYRFHKLKKTKNYKTVGDLVNHDITEIVNNFKSEILKKKVTIFQ